MGKGIFLNRSELFPGILELGYHILKGTLVGLWKLSWNQSQDRVSLLHLAQGFGPAPYKILGIGGNILRAPANVTFDIKKGSSNYLVDGIAQVFYQDGVGCCIELSFQFFQSAIGGESVLDTFS